VIDRISGGGVVASGIGEGVVDDIEDLVQMRTWLKALFGRGRPRTVDETSLESRAVTSPEDAAVSRAEISPEERAVLLVGILDDPAAREDEKDDAAMDLEDFSGPLVESCLIRIIRAEDFTSVLAQQCAESLGGIWARVGRVDPAFMAELRGPAKDEVFGILGIRAPYLLPPGT
jgi:hypothetical protein